MVDYITQLGVFAATYGSGPYGDGSYNNGVSAAAGGSGSLVNTGVAIIGFVTFGCLILFAVFLLRFWRRKRMVAYSRHR